MKKIIPFTFIILFLFGYKFQSIGQIFGNTIQTGYGGYGANQIVWIKFVTGESDSGSFTDFGIYNHPTSGQDCDMKFAIYSDHPTNDRPDDLLVQEYIASTVNGEWNEFPIDPTLTIDANTTYWIGLRFDCNFGSGREVGVNWPEPPLRFKDSWSFFSSWPDPAGSVSTQGFLNNVALYVVGNNETLPVEMLSFEVDKNDQKAILNWVTATEINNSGWNIQKSDNGYTWHTIDWVDGNLNSVNKINYTYEDEIKREGLTFYRLEQVDVDGQKSYSEVRNIEIINNKISVFPNPAEDFLFIRGIEDPVIYTLYDLDGKSLYSKEVIPGASVSIEELNRGQYFLQIEEEVYRFYKK